MDAVDASDAFAAMLAARAEREHLRASVFPVDEAGAYVREEEDENVLVFGPWLERGGSAFWVSTAGTGKSVACMQFAHCLAAGVQFCGLRPRKPLSVWCFQSEDSPRRVAQDRIDVRAELAEAHPGIDWDAVGRERVMFCRAQGKVGAAFVAELDALLAAAERAGEKPDVVILNPFLAYVGGSVSDGTFVTPFLRGGDIGYEHTDGMQAVIERHKVGLLVFHHTPKPPSEKEIDAWMKSRFPEYQGAGSSDVTNWGRSFVTMMRVKGHRNMVCVTAGKNGGELGWETVDGAPRRYMAYSSGVGVSRRGRHAWRDLTDAERAEVVEKAKSDAERGADAKEALAGLSESEVAARVVEWIRANRALTRSELFVPPRELSAGTGLTRGQIRLGKAAIERDYASVYRMTLQEGAYGFAESHRRRREWLSQSARVAAMLAARPGEQLTLVPQQEKGTNAEEDPLA